MGHEALAIIEALSLIHGELGVEERFEVKSVQIHNATVANTALADIAAEPNRQAVLHLGDGCRFQVFNGQVEVLDGATLCDVTEERDGVGLAVGLIGRRRIDEADVLGKIHVDVLFEERLRSDAEVAHEAVRGLDLEIELHRRLTEADAQHVIDGLHHVVLLCTECFHGSAVLIRGAQRAGKLTQLFGEVADDLTRGGRCGGFRHDFLRHDAVLLYEVCEHIPLTAVAERTGKQICNKAACGGLVERL